MNVNINSLNCLITSGGTRIPIDSVRSITNMSSGTFGSKIAESFLDAGCKVRFFHAKNSKKPKPEYGGKYSSKEFDTFEDYANGLNKLIQENNPDIIVLCAAVSDYKIDNSFDGKIDSSDDLTIKLTPTPKIIKYVRDLSPSSLICGFKLLVDSSPELMRQKISDSLISNRCDIIVGNDLSEIKRGNHTLTTAKRSYGRYNPKDHTSEHIVFSTYHQMPHVKLSDFVTFECLNMFM